MQFQAQGGSSTWWRVIGGLLAASALASLPVFARDLTFQDRVNAQEAIERVYYAHRTGTTRSFEQAVPREVIEAKVRRYLQESAALETFWNTPITVEMLEREADRMTRRSRMPERLREIEAALGNDRELILECLARRTLADRLARGFFAFDGEIHEARRLEAETLRDRLLHGEPEAGDPTPVRRLVRLAAVRSEGAPESAADELQPDDYATLRRSIPARPGTPGPVLEERDAFVVRVLLGETSDSFTSSTYVVPKVSWDEWWSRSAPAVRDVVATLAGRASATTPVRRTDLASRPRVTPMTSVAPADCQPGDTWDNGILDNVPESRERHSAVWTGTEMIVWGGEFDSVMLDSGQRYDPATDTWEPTTRVGAPSARSLHTAVWTGSRMIVWGGGGPPRPTSSGGRYDPITDTWSPTSFMGAPSPRTEHTAVWTGSRMVIWGGVSGQDLPVAGGLYDPAADTWSPVSVVGAPEGRWAHGAIWTGSRMIVWGGLTHTASLDTGGLYDPATNAWSPTSTAGAPAPRSAHSVVWSGSQMIAWGGRGGFALNTTFGDGARYDPATNQWAPLSTVGAPQARSSHTAVWTGAQMIVWGGNTGLDVLLASGAVYDPASDTWKPTTATSAPARRVGHTAVWTGRWMIVWGGFSDQSLNNEGARYDPASDTWTPTSITDAPVQRSAHTAVWTGNEMIVWGGAGNSFPGPFGGGRYDPALDTWSPTSMQGAPSPRRGHTAIWTGEEMIIWGGDTSRYINDYGARYDPISDTWTPISSVDAPPGHFGHSAVWSGSRMLVWGGTDDGVRTFASGSRYDPATDTWEPMSAIGAPSPRANHAAVWTGARMIVWGGRAQPGAMEGLQSGGRYDPASDTWSPTSLIGSPTARFGATAVWSGDRMLVWGGNRSNQVLDTGGRYDPGADAWTAMTTIGAPSARTEHTAVWTASRMIVWGGTNLPPIFGPGGSYGTGGSYDPGADRWAAIPTANAPYGRSEHTAIWTGRQMIVWGGVNTDYPSPRFFQSGGRYQPDPLLVEPQADAGPDVTVECAQASGTPVTLHGSGIGCGALSYTWTGAFPEGDGSVHGPEAMVTLGLGEHLITLTMEDEEGQIATDTLTVSVRDTVPPVLQLAADPTLLWPPNHELVLVNVVAQAHDACDEAPAVTLVAATSNEPDDAPGGGDGSTTGDIEAAVLGTPDTSVLVRAERDAQGTGRVYTLTYMAADATGNQRVATVTTSVPRNQRKQLSAAYRPVGGEGMVGSGGSGLRSSGPPDDR